MAYYFLSIKIYLLQLQSDYAFTLKSENELLNQDILTLEEELSKSKEERDKVGFHFVYCWYIESLIKKFN